MRSASMRPLSGPASTDNQAAGGGLEVPGRDAASSVAAARAVDTTHEGQELIPGAREADTMTHREPASIGGQFSGADLPASRTFGSLDAPTAAEHAREGGGGDLKLARKRNASHEREREPPSVP